MERDFLETYNGGKTYDVQWRFRTELKDIRDFVDYVCEFADATNADEIGYVDEHDFGNLDISIHEYKSGKEFKENSEAYVKNHYGTVYVYPVINGERRKCVLNPGSSKYDALVSAGGTKEFITEVEKAVRSCLK